MYHIIHVCRGRFHEAIALGSLEIAERWVKTAEESGLFNQKEDELVIINEKGKLVYSTEK